MQFSTFLPPYENILPPWKLFRPPPHNLVWLWACAAANAAAFFTFKNKSMPNSGLSGRL